MTRKEVKGWAMLIGVVLLVMGYFVVVGWCMKHTPKRVQEYYVPAAVHTHPRHPMGH